MGANHVPPKIIAIREDDPRYDRTEEFLGKYLYAIEKINQWEDEDGWCSVTAKIKKDPLKGFVYRFFMIKLSRIPKKFLKK